MMGGCDDAVLSPSRVGAVAAAGARLGHGASTRIDACGPRLHGPLGATVNYAVLGAGLQGTALAADLAQHGDARRIFVADLDFEAAAAAARADACEPVQLDARDSRAVKAVMERVDVAVSCLPYSMHPALVAPAIETGTSLLDIGGDSEEALATRGRSREAESRGMAIVTDAGLAPGLVNALAALGLSRLEGPRSAKLLCGGLPAHPKPPYGYHATFSLAGLLSEYRDVCFAVREGKVVTVDALGDCERVRWDETLELEAFATSGGSGTAPWVWEGRVDRYEYKTLRFPGHRAAIQALLAAHPPERCERALGEALLGPPDTDQVFLRVEVTGLLDGRPTRWIAELHEHHDPLTGFSAMQRTTAFPAAIAAIEMARGAVLPGCRSFEEAIAADALIEGLASRGIPVRTSVRPQGV